MKNLTEEEQKKLRKEAAKELNRIEALIEKQETRELLDGFKNKFNLCESSYKVILKEYLKRKNIRTDGYLKLIMTQVPFAMNFAGYSFEKSLLKRLFGGERKKGIRSAKVLRDMITHGISESAAEEIKGRKKELNDDIDAFLKIIRKG